MSDYTNDKMIVGQKAERALMSMEYISGSVEHAIISDDCRNNRGDRFAMDDALRRLQDAWSKVSRSFPIGKGVKFHVVLIVEKPAEQKELHKSLTEYVVNKEREQHGKEAQGI